MTRYALIGAGAVGGLYAGRLAADGHELHVLARSDAEHLRARGLRVESPKGDLHVHPDVHTDPSTVPPVDVVLVALKTTANTALRDLLRPLAPPGTTVVVMQNGLGVEAVAADAAPGATVLGALCFVCVTRAAPGLIRHIDYGAVTLGEHRDDGTGAGITKAVESVASDFERSGTDVAAVPDLRAARWRKLVWNIPYNGLSVVLDAGTDELMADASSRALVTALMQEVDAAAHAVGSALPDGFVEEMLVTTDAMVPYATSMKGDYDAGKPMELDAIYANPIRAATVAGCEVPRIDSLWHELVYLDRANTRS